MELLVQRARVFLCLLMHIPRLFSRKVISSLYSQWEQESVIMPSIIVFTFTNLTGENSSLKDDLCAFLLQNFTCLLAQSSFDGMFLCPKSTEAESLGVGLSTLLFQHTQQMTLMNTQIWEPVAQMLNVYSAEPLTLSQ